MDVRRILAIGLSTLVGGDVAAHDFRLGDLTIDHPYALATAATARTGAGYMTIRNDGAEADRLIAVQAPFPSATLHDTEIDGAGVARMIQVDALEIPPGGSVTLAPRGLHVMFVGLEAPFEAGAGIDATLIFEKAGAVAMTFKVEARGSDTAGHDGH